MERDQKFPVEPPTAALYGASRKGGRHTSFASPRGCPTASGTLSASGHVFIIASLPLYPRGTRAPWLETSDFLDATATSCPPKAGGIRYTQTLQESARRDFEPLAPRCRFEFMPQKSSVRKCFLQVLPHIPGRVRVAHPQQSLPIGANHWRKSSNCDSRFSLARGERQEGITLAEFPRCPPAENYS
jgi:hypothetical protein